MADYLRESGVKWLWEKIKTLLSAKQDKLVSGTNIKTINGESLLGSGDVSISGGSGGDFEYKEIQLSPSNADAIIPRYVNTSNVWAVQSNTDVACLFLVHKGDKIKIQANASYYCVYTLLTTKDIDYTVAPPFVGDWRRTVINANQEVEFEVPQRCYLYIYNKTSNESNYFPQVANRNAVFTGLSEVALRAGQADKLTIARTINLSEGAIGTATAFDGSKNIDIPVTKMYDSYILWGGKLVSANISPLDATSPMFSANRLALFPPENISVEYTTDGGSTWQDYGATSQSKILFTTPELGTASYKVGNKTGSSSASDMVRVTFNGEGCYRYSRLNKILLYVNNCTAAAKAYITVETETYSGTIRENTYKYVQGVAGWNSIPLMYDFPFGNSNQTNVIKRLTITLKVESNAISVPLLRNIFAIGNTSYNAQYPFDKHGHIYSFDEAQNATFPNAVKGKKLVTDGGKSTQVVKGDGSLEEESALAVASAIDAEHAEEADYAGVADKADKLTTARTISLGGAARGSTTFDGSTGREIDVTTLYEAFMLYGGKAIAGDVSPIDGAAVSELWCNKFAYYNPDYINVEYTNNYSEDADGNESSDVIWTEYPYINTNNRLDKLFLLVTGGLGNFYSSGSSSNGTAIAGKTRLRVTFNTYLARYIAPKKLLIRVSASAQRLNNQIKVEVVSKTDYDAGNTNKFTHYSTNVVSGDAGWNSMSFASSFGSATNAAIKKLRITFIVNGVDTTNRPPALHNIYMIGKHHSANDDNLAASGHFYKYDYQKNMEIPNAFAPMTARAQNIGYASRPWKNVYAQKYVTDGGTNQQAVLGDGSLIPLSELSPITDADAEILLDNHIHSINVNANGNNVNISVIESSKYGDTWETEDNDITIPLATTTSAGVMSKEDKDKLDNLSDNGEDTRYTQFIEALYNISQPVYIPSESTFDGIYEWNDGADGSTPGLYGYHDGKAVYLNTFDYPYSYFWEEANCAAPLPTIPVATTTSGGVMSPADKIKLDSLSTSTGGMTISGTVNLTIGTFNTIGNTSLSTYGSVFGDMSVGEMRMYLVSDSNGNLPSTSETAVTVPHEGVLSPAQLYFGKSAAFGVSVGDICVLFKKSSLLNICRIIPLNDVKPSNGDFPGADGLSTVWDKERINKVDGIEWTANYVRDNYLHKDNRFPSRADWLINVDNCIDNGVYPTCDATSMNVGWTNQYATLVVQRTSTADNGGYNTVEQTAYGRGSDEGQIYKRIIFVKSDDSDIQYGNWKRIDSESSVIEIKYTLTESEYANHEIVNLYNIVYAISNRLYNNGWLYNDDKSYDVVVKGWVDNRYNAITYANFNVRLLTTQDGHSLGINGYVDVAQITETNENADCPLWVGYICGKYHIEDDGMAFYAPENPNFIVEA